jgi:hypothetical protein
MLLAFYYLIVLYLAAVLCVAGITKYIYQSEFANTLKSQGVVPHIAIPLFTKILPIYEILLAMYLIWYPLSGSMLVAITFGAFVCFRLLLMKKTRLAGCGCYGPFLGLDSDKASLAATLIQTSMAIVLVAWSDTFLSQAAIQMTATGVMIVFLVVVIRRNRIPYRSNDGRPITFSDVTQ